MSTNLAEKKLLLLGGSSDMIDVTKLAQKMGCKVYVTDYYDTERSPAKLYADEYANISIADHDAVVAYIKENGIDGVMTGFTDSYLCHYLQICEKAGLPHYGTEKAFGIATDKMLFKKACAESGVPTIPGINAYDFDAVKAFAKKNCYPLMLKPADNSGSRGVIKCEKEDDLQKCYEYALSFSPTANVIVERYMDCRSIGIVYQLEKGKARLAAVCDRDIYSSENGGSAIICATRYPSEYLERYIQEVDKQMREMLSKNEFTDGMVSPMAFVDDDGFYFCEMCYRPSGGHHYFLIDNQNGINGLALLIEFAVTGKTESYNPEFETPYFKKYCGMIHIIGTSGKKIASFKGIDEISGMKEVIFACQDLQIGETIGKDGTSAQIVASVWYNAKDEKDFNRLGRIITSMLDVRDENGDSLVVC